MNAQLRLSCTMEMCLKYKIWISATHKLNTVEDRNKQDNQNGLKNKLHCP